MRAAIQNPAVVLVFSAEDVKSYGEALRTALDAVEGLIDATVRKRMESRWLASTANERDEIDASVSRDVDGIVRSRAHLQTLLNEVTR